MSSNDLASATVNSAETKNGKPAEMKWTYSGKALRGRKILCLLITLVLLAIAIAANILWNDSRLPVWLGFAILAVALWVQFCCVYFYRTRTIRFELTELRLYSYQGFLTKVQNTLELAFIEDLQVKQTLWDRIINGGVGTILIFSRTDKTNLQTNETGYNVLVIPGVEHPKAKFEEIDNRRSELRRTRAILASS